MGLFSEIKSDWEANGRDWTRPGFQALVQYRFGVWRMGLRPLIVRAPFSVLYRILHRRSRNRHGIELPYHAQVGRGVVIEHQSGIVIHGNATIGDGCIIRQGVTIGNRDLDDPEGAPVLGRDVNVGAGAMILGRVTIGDGARIGANSVVVKDVGPGQTVVGIPARVVASRH